MGDIVRNGITVHQKYGSFLLLDPEHPQGYSVAHLEFLQSNRFGRWEKKQDFGSTELLRIRSILQSKAKTKKSNRQYDECVKLWDHKKKRKLEQRIGLLKQLAVIGALSPCLKPTLQDIITLSSACGMSIPTGCDLVVT